MFIDKLLSLLIYPLGFSFCIGGLGFLLWRLGKNRWAARFLFFSLGWLLVWSLPPVSDAVNESLEAQFDYQLVESHLEAQVIVVFGGVMRPAFGKYPYPDLGSSADRVWHAARLYHAGKAPHVLLSGGGFGRSAGVPTEAESMCVLLRDLGVPDSAISLETQSTTTRGNALYSAQKIREAGFDKVLLVTSALHMARALGAMRVAGVEAIPAPTDYQVANWRDGRLFNLLPSADALASSTYAIHEYIGLWVYRWRGWA